MRWAGKKDVSMSRLPVVQVDTWLKQYRTAVSDGQRKDRPSMPQDGQRDVRERNQDHQKLSVGWASFGGRLWSCAEVSNNGEQGLPGDWNRSQELQTENRKVQISKRKQNPSANLQFSMINLQ